MHLIFLPYTPTPLGDPPVMRSITVFLMCLVMGGSAMAQLYNSFINCVTPKSVPGTNVDTGEAARSNNSCIVSLEALSPTYCIHSCGASSDMILRDRVATSPEVSGTDYRNRPIAWILDSDTPTTRPDIPSAVPPSIIPHPHAHVPTLSPRSRLLHVRQNWAISRVLNRPISKRFSHGLRTVWTDVHKAGVVSHRYLPVGTRSRLMVDPQIKGRFGST